MFTQTIDHLQNDDAILIAEACSHHPIEEDIARVKIPRLLKQYTKKTLDICFARSHDFPVEHKPFKLVIHCGACMMNKSEVLNRLHLCCEKNIPMTNYGLVIAYTLKIFHRALSPFKDVFQQLSHPDTIQFAGGQHELIYSENSNSSQNNRSSKT
jgi:predicted GTPase